MTTLSTQSESSLPLIHNLTLQNPSPAFPMDLIPLVVYELLQSDEPYTVVDLMLASRRTYDAVGRVLYRDVTMMPHGMRSFALGLQPISRKDLGFPKLVDEVEWMIPVEPGHLSAKTHARKAALLSGVRRWHIKRTRQRGETDRIWRALIDWSSRQITSSEGLFRNLQHFQIELASVTRIIGRQTADKICIDHGDKWPHYVVSHALSLVVTEWTQGRDCDISSHRARHGFARFINTGHDSRCRSLRHFSRPIELYPTPLDFDDVTSSLSDFVNDTIGDFVSEMKAWADVPEQDRFQVMTFAVAARLISPTGPPGRSSIVKHRFSPIVDGRMVAEIARRLLQDDWECEVDGWDAHALESYLARREKPVVVLQTVSMSDRCEVCGNGSAHDVPSKESPPASGEAVIVHDEPQHRFYILRPKHVEPLPLTLSPESDISRPWRL